MYSSSSDPAEEKWLAQLAAMRAAVAGLTLPVTQTSGQEASQHAGYSDKDMTSSNSGDDVWDFISDTEADQYSSDFSEGVDTPAKTDGDGYGPKWFKSKCILFAIKGRVISAEGLQQQIIAVLSSDSAEEEIQSTLTDIIGFDDLDFVIELITHRNELRSLPLSESSSKPTDGTAWRLQTKRQREEALRQQDYEHKHAILGPNLHRDGPQYPHVYKAHTAGNILSASGRKYALPVGSERKEHEVQFHRTCSCIVY